MPTKPTKDYQMKYYYEETESYEIVRWFRWKKDADVRSHRPPKGLDCSAMILDYHPTTLKTLKQSEWWIMEKKVLTSSSDLV